MQYISHYTSPLGRIALFADDEGLTGLWFEGQKYFAYSVEKGGDEESIPVLDEAKHWLDIYFSGKNPDFTPPLHLKGSPFQMDVWEILLTIKYGSVLTYGDIAKKIAERRGINKMASQAVGGAVGHNPISIIVPCHRVVGAGGNLTGYGGGIDKKIKLLELEGLDLSSFYVPKKGTAL